MKTLYIVSAISEKISVIRVKIRAIRVKKLTSFV